MYKNPLITKEENQYVNAFVKKINKIFKDETITDVSFKIKTELINCLIDALFLENYPSMTVDKKIGTITIPRKI